VVFSNPHSTPAAGDLIKRVIAVGGETFEIRNGAVYIDGARLDEPYLSPAEKTHPISLIPGCSNTPAAERCEVPAGKLLVLGDNRTSSRDGRYFGPIDSDTVAGRAFMKYWPPDDIGGL